MPKTTNNPAWAAGLLALAVALPASAAVQAPKDGAVRFQPPGYPFSVAMPEPPVKSRRSTSTVIGSVFTDVWISAGDYSIAITDLPGIALWFNDAEDLFEKARDQMLGELGATAERRWPIRHGPFSEVLEYRMPTGPDGVAPRGRAYFALIDDKLIVVTAVAEPAASATLDRYFAQLRIEG